MKLLVLAALLVTAGCVGKSSAPSDTVNPAADSRSPTPSSAPAAAASGPVSGGPNATPAAAAPHTETSEGDAQTQAVGAPCAPPSAGCSASVGSTAAVALKIARGTLTNATVTVTWTAATPLEKTLTADACSKAFTPEAKCYAHAKGESPLTFSVPVAPLDGLGELDVVVAPDAPGVETTPAHVVLTMLVVS